MYTQSLESSHKTFVQEKMHQQETKYIDDKLAGLFEVSR